jgi:hypothetical protein
MSHLNKWRHNIQTLNTQHNDTFHTDIQHNSFSTQYQHNVQFVLSASLFSMCNYTDIVVLNVIIFSVVSLKVVALTEAFE